MPHQGFITVRPQNYIFFDLHNKSFIVTQHFLHTLHTYLHCILPVYDIHAKYKKLSYRLQVLYVQHSTQGQLKVATQQQLYLISRSNDGKYICNKAEHSTPWHDMVYWGLITPQSTKQLQWCKFLQNSALINSKSNVSEYCSSAPWHTSL